MLAVAAAATLAENYTVIEPAPVALDLWFIELRWYSLAYIVGLLLAWRYMIRLTRLQPEPLEKATIDDFFFWCAIGVVLGGRIGFVLFYQPLHYLDYPHHILYLWQGGMAFHGGLLGVVLVTYLFARKRGVHPFYISDLIACSVPIGLMLGRLANFVNGELPGRPSEVPWAMIFPATDMLPRHPSQLYEALLEGALLLGVFAFLAYRKRFLDYRGMMTGLFLVGYGLARITVEFFRKPDDYPDLAYTNLAYSTGWITQGQILSFPMVVIGVFIIVWALQDGRKPGMIKQ